MESSNLRIGNLVYRNGRAKTIDAILSNGSVEFDDSSQPFSMAEIEPIPLTEEILLKCGFEKDDGEYGGFLSPLAGDSRMRVYVENGFVYYQVNDYRRLKIASVHHLQNFYFDLMEQELEVSF